MKYVITLNGKRYEAEVARIDDFTPLTRANAAAAPAPAAPIVVNAPAAPAPAPVVAPAPAAAPTPAPAPAPAAPAAAGATTVTAPMPGNILDVPCTVGQAVTAGQTLVVLEAMKMENEIVAPVAGTVASINVKKGDTVETDAVLVTLN